MSKIMNYILRNQEEGKEFKQLISQEQALPSDYQKTIDEQKTLDEAWWIEQDAKFKDTDSPIF